MENIWLIEETRPPDQVVFREMAHKLKTGRESATRGALDTPLIAVRIQDLIIHDNKKWFGEADIRLDALVVHGNGKTNEPESFYMPQTFRFPRVTDGDRLPTGDTGLLIFYGKPLYFLDVFITVSRDRKDSDDLSTLLSQQFQAKEMQEAISTLLGLAVVAPQVAVVTAALSATTVIGNFAYQILRQATGSTIGLYHTSLLQYRDKFGIGRHPEKGAYREKDLSFWYEIVLEKAAD